MTSQQVMSPLTTIQFSGEPKDWPDWSFRYEALAAQLGFLDVMIGTSTEEDANKKSAMSKQAYYSLVTCMKGDGLRVIKRAKKGDGADAWKILRERFNSAAESRKDMLQAQLYDESRVL